MSSKKGVGSSKNGRDSESKRLGLKIGAGQYVSAGSKTERNQVPPGQQRWYRWR